MQPIAAHGTAFRRSPALCKASGFMIETVQSRRIVGMRIVDTIAGAQRTPWITQYLFGLHSNHQTVRCANSEKDYRK